MVHILKIIDMLKEILRPPHDSPHICSTLFAKWFKWRRWNTSPHEEKKKMSQTILLLNHMKQEPLTSWLLLRKTHPGLWQPQTRTGTTKPSWEWNELERKPWVPSQELEHAIIFTVFLINIKTKVQGQPIWYYLYHSMSNQSLRKTAYKWVCFQCFLCLKTKHLKIVFKCLFNAFPKRHVNILFSK